MLMTNWNSTHGARLPTKAQLPARVPTGTKVRIECSITAAWRRFPSQNSRETCCGLRPLNIVPPQWSDTQRCCSKQPTLRLPTTYCSDCAGPQGITLVRFPSIAFRCATGNRIVLLQTTNETFSTHSRFSRMSASIHPARSFIDLER